MPVATTLPHLPILRFGAEYESLDRVRLCAHASGAPLAEVSQANAGLVRRDLLLGQERAAAALRAIPVRELLAMCAEAGRLFLEADLPLAGDGPRQSPQDYVEHLSATSGLPHALCRANMRKVHQVFTEMPTVLAGLTRGMDLDVIDRGLGAHGGVPVSYAPLARSLGVVLPSNSPGVNSIWMPAIALKTPVVLKPGREEPWTPLRIVRAFEAAGVPGEAFGFYPTGHDGAAAVLELCDRSILFGDASTTAAWAADPRVEVHGPGYSKVLLGDDAADAWEDHLDVLTASVLDNGGRSCINASAIVVPRHADAIAEALAERLARVEPLPPADPAAALSAFANPRVAEWVDATIERGLARPGAADVTARHRRGARRVELDGAVYLRPTLVRCADPVHPLANTEFMFPFASVVEVPQSEVLGWIGHSLVVTAITRDASFASSLLACSDIDRLNLGPVPTSRVDWDQPHEGNLFETLYGRRAIRRVGGW